MWGGVREECSRSSLTSKRFSHQGKRGVPRTYLRRKVLKGIEGPSLENRKSIDGSHAGGNEKNREPKRLSMGCSGSQRGLKERKRELIAGGGHGYWQDPLFAGGGPGYWQNPLFAGGGPGRWQDPLFAGVGHGYWQKTPFRWQSVRATGVGSTAQINAQACNSEKRCDSLQITFLLKDNYAKIKYQNIKDGHKTNEQLFYIRSTYLRTAA